MNINKTLIMIITLFFLSAVQSETVSVPQLINYQGMLTNAEGQPLETKEYKLSFSIFNQPTGGTAVWGPQIFDGKLEVGHGAKVPVVRGHFNVILGPQDINKRIVTEAFQTDKAYLEISVENNNPIMPRQRILTTPYSVVSKTVKGPDLFVDSENGYVGLGSKTPRASLFIKHSGTNDTPSILINNSSPEIVFETESSHYNWRIAAQEDIDSGLEISSGNKDADASDDSDLDWKNLFIIKRVNNIANVMVHGHLSITEQPRCRVRLASNKGHSFCSNAWKDFEWDVEDYDVGDCWSSEHKERFVAPITGLYSLQGLIITDNTSDSFTFIQVYYLNDGAKNYIGYWTHDRNTNRHIEFISISLQHYMVQNSCLVFEVLSSNSNGSFYGGLPEKDHIDISFMTYAKIQ